MKFPRNFVFKPGHHVTFLHCFPIPFRRVNQSTTVGAICSRTRREQSENRRKCPNIGRNCSKKSELSKINGTTRNRQKFPKLDGIGDHPKRDAIFRDRCSQKCAKSNEFRYRRYWGGDNGCNLHVNTVDFFLNKSCEVLLTIKGANVAWQKMAFIFHWSVSKYTSLHERISYHGVIWFPGYFITIVTIVMHNNISKVVRNKLDLKNKDRTRLFSLENLRLNALLFCYSGNVRLSTGLCISPVQGERHLSDWVSYRLLS